MRIGLIMWVGFIMNGILYLNIFAISVIPLFLLAPAGDPYIVSKWL